MTAIPVLGVDSVYPSPPFRAPIDATTPVVVPLGVTPSLLPGQYLTPIAAPNPLFVLGGTQPINLATTGYTVSGSPVPTIGTLPRSSVQSAGFGFLLIDGRNWVELTRQAADALSVTPGFYQLS